jgi:galactose mutarotase-like enzyme
MNLEESPRFRPPSGEQFAIAYADAQVEVSQVGAGRAVARLHDPDSRRSVQLWVDDAYRYLMVYTADGVARPDRRRAAVAIEPMTCPPDAFRTGADLIELEPGESWQGIWGLRSDPA